MIITSNQEEQLIVSPPQFHLEPPRESPFEAVSPATVTSSEGSFDFAWIQKPAETGMATVEGILKDIVQRARWDAERFQSSAEAHANLGLALANCGRLTEAVDEFSIALKISPRHFMAMANLARIRALQGLFDEAERLYEQMAKDYPKELSPLVNLSYIFLRTAKFLQATEILNRAIDVDAEAIFPRYLMAVSLLTLGKSREAIRHLRFAARTDVRSPAIHQALGVAYLMSGDIKNALRSFKTAVTLAPEMKDAVHALANVLLQKGHTDSLVDLLAAYLQRQPNDITARELLSNAHSQLKQYPLARLQLTTALRQLQGDDKHNQKQKAKLLNNIGYCFDRQHDIDASAQWFSRSIEVDPTFDAVPYHNLARVYVRKRQFVQAWRILERCIEVFPDNHETPAVQAFVLSEQDRNDEAIEVLKRELATGKATPNSYATLGWFLTDLKPDRKTAEQVLADGLKRYPQDPILINNLAYVLLMQGRPVEARAVLSSLKIESNGIRPEDRIYLTATWGLLYLWEGDIAAGRQSYERARLMAFESPQKSLPKIVEQKMHLELARAFLRQHDIATAISEIRRGLSIKEGRTCYEHDLTALIEDYSERN